MREIVVISGKGGTGKTTVAASLAVVAAEGTTSRLGSSGPVIADCDVDAANLGLILGARPRESRDFSGSRVAKVLEGRCGSPSGCDRCVEACRAGAVSYERGRGPVVDPDNCEGCGVCRAICPSSAFDLVPVVTGTWFVSDTRCGPMVHARLRPGGESCGQLVTIVRNEARRIALALDKSLIIADGPPGIGCPVLASLTGATSALVVTEPTYSAIHDLERILAVADHFGVPAMVAINRFDIDPGNSKRLEEQCVARDIPVVGRIPYDREVTRALAEGRTPVERGKGEAAVKIRAAANRALELASGNGGACPGPQNASPGEVELCRDHPSRDW